mmetsp:Transcript_852/g.1031  ORF Transcript_852/g.1031 Transcript_852/m.1031 type:complete len:380 (-) Transcript_852:87-1226(-)
MNLSRILVNSEVSRLAPTLALSRNTNKTLLNATVARFASSSSSSSSSSKSFRPRRVTPTPLHESPKPKYKSKKAKAPIVLTSKTVTTNTLDKTYGTDAANTIRSLRRTKDRKGLLHPETMVPNAETVLNAADYLSSDLGTIEDLVGERRALRMDAWDDKQAEEFSKELDALIAKESEAPFDDLPWLQKETGFGITKADVNDDEKDVDDPHQKAFGPWSETIVRVDRVQKVQRGGTMVRYRALVVGGNLNGCAGFGVAKANAPNEACAAAARIAKRNIFFVDRYMNTGLTSDLAGKHNSCKVTLRSVNFNRGLHGHPLILEILKYFGITDCTAKSHGNRNVYNVVYSTFKAIMTHESLEEIALKRGKRLLNLERAKRLNI